MEKKNIKAKKSFEKEEQKIASRKEREKKNTKISFDLFEMELREELNKLFAAEK